MADGTDTTTSQYNQFGENGNNNIQIGSKSLLNGVEFQYTLSLELPSSSVPTDPNEKEAISLFIDKEKSSSPNPFPFILMSFTTEDSLYHAIERNPSLQQGQAFKITDIQQGSIKTIKLVDITVDNETKTALLRELVEKFYDKIKDITNDNVSAGTNVEEIKKTIMTALNNKSNITDSINNDNKEAIVDTIITTLLGLTSVDSIKNDLIADTIKNQLAEAYKKTYDVIVTELTVSIDPIISKKEITVKTFNIKTNKTGETYYPVYLFISERPAYKRSLGTLGKIEYAFGKGHVAEDIGKIKAYETELLKTINKVNSILDDNNNIFDNIKGHLKGYGFTSYFRDATKRKDEVIKSINAVKDIVSKTINGNTVTITTEDVSNFETNYTGYRRLLSGPDTPFGVRGISTPDSRITYETFKNKLELLNNFMDKAKPPSCNDDNATDNCIKKSTYDAINTIYIPLYKLLQTGFGRFGAMAVGVPLNLPIVRPALEMGKKQFFSGKDSFTNWLTKRKSAPATTTTPTIGGSLKYQQKRYKVYTTDDGKRYINVEKKKHYLKESSKGTYITRHGKREYI